VVHADIADENGIRREATVDLERGPLRIDRLAIVAEAGRDQPVPFLPIAVDRVQPFLPCVGALVQVPSAIELRMHLAKESAHVRHQPKRDRIIAADLLGIDVDVDKPGRRNGEGIPGNPGARGAIVGTRGSRHPP
jgi:hypothetical protein